MSAEMFTRSRHIVAVEVNPTQAANDGGRSRWCKEKLAGTGFKLPSVVPNVPKFAEKGEAKRAA